MLSILKEIPLNTEICIYGAGETGIFIKDLLNDVRKDIKISYFLDSFKSGNVDDIEIIKLDDIEEVTKSPNESGMTYDLILICSAFWQEITGSLIQRGISNFKVLDYALYCEFKQELKQKVLNELFSTKTCEEFIQESLDFKVANFQKGFYPALNSIPKSGTAFFSKLMNNLTGLENIRLTRIVNGRTNNKSIYYPLLLNIFEKNCLCPIWHIQGFEYNIEILKNFNIKTVFLYRNIFDIIASLRDFYLATDKILHPPFYLDDINFFNLETEEQYNTLIEIELKGHLENFLSWYNAKQKYDKEIMFITYKELVDDTFNTLNKILKFYGLSKTDDEILKAIELTNSRKKVDPQMNFNKGIKGRGKALLTEKQKQRIYDQIKLYKN